MERNGHSKAPDRAIYYVYVLFDWLAVPRYVGKGKRNRETDHERSSSTNWLKDEFIAQTWKMLGNIPKIRVREALTNDEACVIEIALIAAIGRADQRNGPLTNLTDGGEGVIGGRWKLSPEVVERNMERYKRQMAHANSCLTPERRRKNAAMMHDKVRQMSPEERGEIIRRSNASRTPKQRKEIALKGRASRSQTATRVDRLKSTGPLTKEQRHERAIKINAAQSPEERSKRQLRAWETRRLRNWQWQEAIHPRDGGGKFSARTTALDKETVLACGAS